MPFPAPRYTLHAITSTSRDALDPIEALDFPEAERAAAFVLAQHLNVSAVLIREADTGYAVTTVDRVRIDDELEPRCCLVAFCPRPSQGRVTVGGRKVRACAAHARALGFDLYRGGAV